MELYFFTNIGPTSDKAGGDERGWEKRSGGGSNHWVISAAEVKIAWSYTTIPPPALMALSVIKPRHDY
jgi:hypothetical protein